MRSIIHCPFCGATPHRGLTPKTIGQDGEPFQHYAIWCPHLCARIERVNEAAAVADWNARPEEDAAGLLGALKIAEDFMADFVGDRPEDAEKLAAVRSAIAKAEARHA